MILGLYATELAPTNVFDLMCRNDMRQGCVCPPSNPILASESIITLKCTFCFYPNRINWSGIQYIRHHTSYHEKANKKRKAEKPEVPASLAAAKYVGADAVIS